MLLPRKAKEAIKTALAMTITYGIALSMDWDKPYWAGIAVVVISMASIGQSLNKAALRILGTLVAVVFAFILMALFVQERWTFMLFLSIFTGFCTYMMSGGKHAYFWQVCGFVCVIVCMDAGPNADNAFEIGVLRAQETGLGILVYSLVSMLLWPSSSRADFNTATANLASIQYQVYKACFDLASKLGNAQEAERLSTQELQVKTRFDKLLDAAETDCNEVWEQRKAWRCYQQQATELMQTMGHWRENFAEAQALDLQQLLPNLAGFDAELDGRMAEIGHMLAGDAPERVPQVIDLPLDKDVVRRLSHFHRAAFAVTHSRMLHLERLTRSLFGTVSDIKGFGTTTAACVTPRAQTRVLLPDLERMTNVVRFLAIMWLAWLAVIYVNGFPGGPGFVSMAGAFGIAIANMPQLPLSLLFTPAATSILLVGALYIFVMPLLSSFIGLGLLIFAATFAICYLFAEPRQVLGRTFGLIMFVVVASISNEQSYNFLSVTTTALMFPLIFLLLAITSYIPFSPRPERVFLRLLGRFFRSSEYLMSTIHWDPVRPPSRLDRWRKAFHERELATLPSKLGAWTPHLHFKVLPGTSPEQVQAVLTSLQVLTYRMQQLLEASGNPQAKFLVQQLFEDFRAWHLKVQGSFQLLSEKPAIGEHEAFGTGLDRIMGHMETRIMESIDKAVDGQFSGQDAENFYRLLGAYRNVSEALIDYTGNADVIDWTHWREEHFT